MKRGTSQKIINKIQKKKKTKIGNSRLKLLTDGGNSINNCIVKLFS